MSNLINFDFESKQVRSVLIDNNPWFVATDICDILKLTNTSKALQSLDSDERSNFKLGRQGDVNIINESGLYVLILRCRDAVKNGTMAYRFRKWVTNEVLPSIRKTGSYSVTINAEQQYLIQKAVSERSSETGIHWATLYVMLHDEFKIPRYQELKVVDFERAIEFIKTATKKNNIHSDIDHNLKALCVNMIWLLSWWDRYEPAIRILNHKVAGNVHDRFKDSYLIASQILRSGYPEYSLRVRHLTGYPWDGDYYEKNGFIKLLQEEIKYL